MLTTSGHNSTALASHIRQQIDRLAPFGSGPDGDIFLIKPLQDRTPADHEDALRYLASSGVLSDYRYVAGSQPVILVTRPA